MISNRQIMTAALIAAVIFILILNQMIWAESYVRPKFNKQIDFKLASSGQKEPMVNAHRTNQNAESRASCTSGLILTPGVPYLGDTTGQGDDFNTTDYPGLGWDEYGPDVSHQITVSSTCDLRIFLDYDPFPAPDLTRDLDIILIDDSGGGCDTADWLYAGDYAIIYHNCPPGTYHIIVDGYTPTDEGPYELTVATASGLLLIDDDNSGDGSACGGTCPDVQSYYTDALLNMSNPPTPSYSVWDMVVAGDPSEATINNAKYIIWFCGYSYEEGTTITTANEDMLIKYCRLGGRLMIVGQDILWDYMDGANGRLPDGSLFNDYMQINEVYHDIWDTETTNYTLDGISGNPIGDVLDCNDTGKIINQYTTGNNAPFTSYSDSIVTRFGDPVFYNNYVSGDTNSQKPVAVRSQTALGNISDYHKSFFLAFPPECDDPAQVLSNMIDLFEETIRWFDESDSTQCGEYIGVVGYFDDTTLGDGDGIPDPAEDFYFDVEITNSDSVSHSIKVYCSFEDYYVTRYSPYCADLGSLGPSGTATASFHLRMLSTTPIGYRVLPEFNIILDSGTEEYCFRASFGAFVEQAEVLLVKDEYWFPNTTGVDIYTSTLANLGRSTAVWDTASFGSPTYDTYGLTNDLMMNYDFIIWFTGYDSYFTLTPDPYDQVLGINPELELETYLTTRQTDTGEPARLIISTQDYLYEKYNGTSQSIPIGDFARDFLMISYVTQDFLRDASSMLHGIDGSWSAEKMSMGINTFDDGGIFYNYADRISGDFSQSGTQYLWTYAQPATYAAISNLNKDRNSRFCFMPFAFENVQDGTPGGFPSKERFLEKLMCQMEMTISDDIPLCGYYPLPCVDTLTTFSGSDPYFIWSAVDPTEFKNTIGEPVFGRYRIRYDLDNPDLDNAAYVEYKFDVNDTTFIMDQIVPAGSCYFYRIDCIDAFDQTGPSCL